MDLLGSPDVPRVQSCLRTPHEKTIQRPHSSPGEKSPLKHRQVLQNAGLGLNKRMLLNNRNPRPHRLVFDSSRLNDSVGMQRPAGDSPDKENESPSGAGEKITAQKLPVLVPRFLLPRPPAVALPVAAMLECEDSLLPIPPAHPRVQHYSSIVMQPPGDEAPLNRTRRPNRHIKIGPVEHKPLPIVDMSLYLPEPKAHGNALDPMDERPTASEAECTPQSRSAAPFYDSPLSPSFGLEPRPLHAEEHAALQLFACVRRGDLTSVRTALKGAALTANARDEFGNTILIIAAEMGNRDMGKLAIRFGVDVNLVNFEGNSALHVACASGHTRFCRLLLRNGADPMLVNDAGLSCLDMNPALLSPHRSASVGV